LRLRSAPMRTKPFAGLKKQIEKKKVRLPEVNLPEPPSQAMTPDEERELFLQAMAGVTPLPQKVSSPCRRDPPVQPASLKETADADSVRKLKRLVETGEGFVLKFTAEYMEGAAAKAPPELFRRLHAGHFSIQGHLDLHGLGVESAKSAFDGFIRRSVALGYRAVLIVHGRGRRSPGPPVLKRNLVGWLTTGKWKKWVIAYTSARACDGGTGATYVLLRKKRQNRLSAWDLWCIKIAVYPGVA
jgi:DNA-nicking Smr family endonuclease